MHSAPRSATKFVAARRRKETSRCLPKLKFPAPGGSVSEATIGEWLKQPGEAVGLDEPIASLETDKVAIEVTAPVAGVMGQQIAKLGDTVAVGAVIATVEDGTPFGRGLSRWPPVPKPR